jgi:hypothetical protein
MRIRDPGWKKFGYGVRDKHPRSATLPLVTCLLAVNFNYTIILADH